MTNFTLSESARSAIMDVLTESKPNIADATEFCRLPNVWLLKKMEHSFPQIPMDAFVDLHHPDNLLESIQTNWASGHKEPNELAGLDKHHLDSLTPEELHAVKRYVTGGLLNNGKTGSRSLNNYLVDVHNRGEQPTRNFQQHSAFANDPHPFIRIDHLDSAIRKNSLPENSVTYTGMTVDPQTFMDANRTVGFPNYLSASTVKRSSLGYAIHGGDIGHILQIHHHTETSGLYVGNDKRATHFDHDEVILPRGMYVSILPNPKEISVFGKRVMIHRGIRNYKSGLGDTQYEYKD